jgi:hypothetical protein
MEDTRIDRYRPLGRAGHPSGRQASLCAYVAALGTDRARKTQTIDAIRFWAKAG